MQSIVTCTSIDVAVLDGSRLGAGDDIQAAATETTREARDMNDWNLAATGADAQSSSRMEHT
jgi:hypothetical protein